MPEPLSIFTAKFLYYHSTENPSEILAETILKKIENPMPTSVFIALYSHGFYVKGNLQHISHDQTKSRPSQFISVDLLRKVYQFSLQNNFIIMIFHETINLIFEVSLFLFSFGLINECHRFHNYLEILLNDKFCNMKMFEILSMKSDNQYFNDSEIIDSFHNRNESIELEIPVSMSTSRKYTNKSSNLLNSLEFTDNSNKFIDETTSEEILDSSYLSDSSNDLNDVFTNHVKYEYESSVKYPDKIEIINENIEKFVEQTIYKTKKSSLFFDEQTDTLNSINSIETFCQNDDNTDFINDFDNYSDFDKRDSLSSLSNITEDFGNFNDTSIINSKHLFIGQFPNENQTRKLLNSLNSIEEEHKSKSFDVCGNLSDRNVSSQENNDRKISKYSDNYNNNDYINNFTKQIPSNTQNRNIFCWPDFLKNESKFTTSILVEMPFSFDKLNNNWSLIDKIDSLNDKESGKHLKWYEQVDRIHYNYKKKNFEIDENGSLVIYCCRQICNEGENTD